MFRSFYNWILIQLGRRVRLKVWSGQGLSSYIRDKDGKYTVLRGYRRMEAARLIRQSEEDTLPITAEDVAELYADILKSEIH